MATQTPMQLGMVGLGRMGAGLVRRLIKDGHSCVGYDVSADAVKALEADGAAGAGSLEEFAAKLEKPRTAWVMVPAGQITDKTIESLAEVLEPGDTIIDGGNTYYRDDLRHAAALKEKGIHHVDVGTSGGVWGIERGFCLMIGGEDEDRGAPAADLRLDRAGRRRRRRARPAARASRRPPSRASTTAGRTARATS